MLTGATAGFTSNPAHCSMNFLSRRCWLCLLMLFSWVVVAAQMPDVHDSVMWSGGVSGLFDSERNPVVLLDYRFATHWKGLRPWLGLGWATDGAIFAGGGALYSVGTRDGLWTFSAGTGPGYYERHHGEDLGSHLEFCTFAEVARRLPWKHQVVVRLVHISNGGVTERNPGAELLMLGYAMPLP